MTRERVCANTFQILAVSFSGPPYLPCTMPLRLLCRIDCPEWLSGSSLLCSEQCTAQGRLKDVLCSKFHHASFRPGQLEALLSVAHGHDVFVRMPTGGGKSVCMFLIPLALDNEAMGIIISPLVGLMDQQVSCPSPVCCNKCSSLFVGVSAYICWSVCYSCIQYGAYF